MFFNKDTLHLPDLLFFEYCRDTYQINRGVYNTIESWFYNQGEKDILSRRNQLLCFLNYNEELGVVNAKFGRGGLSERLNNFYELKSTS